ncbi:glutamine amidotransferase [Lipingzhangella sp. LS1_29]|uniref:Lipid II isoglutaminyl synthase (glutamine-hydrolyzing) subunit GatD n=1 Tax=Lipingzhangella rawalii TaxID=2055835 RepID=A0ABU2H5X1_9ACTN|nr:glutamine amidotransferase [Lipingzhangella rawalii]MDS1270255.1 glutamine amidotransferase [Lipingzhangella rawalii]
MTDTSSTLRIVWVYPDLLSTYGDQGNALVLRRRAEQRGVCTEIVHVNSSDRVPREGDIYLLGGGEDRPQVLAAHRLRACGGLLRAAEDGAVVLAVCAGYQIVGESFGDDEANPLPGVGLLDIRSGRGQHRAVGEVVADAAPALGVGQLTGFENHQGRTALGPGVAPLAETRVGVGNGDGTEGCFRGRVIGSYLHGPILPRNPALADVLLGWAMGDLPPLPPSWSERLHEERLAAAG